MQPNAHKSFVKLSFDGSDLSASGETYSAVPTRLYAMSSLVFSFSCSKVSSETNLNFFLSKMYPFLVAVAKSI